MECVAILIFNYRGIFYYLEELSECAPALSFFEGICLIWKLIKSLPAPPVQLGFDGGGYGCDVMVHTPNLIRGNISKGFSLTFIELTRGVDVLLKLLGCIPVCM